MLEHKGKKIYLVCGPNDMRKRIDGLCAIVSLKHICDTDESAMCFLQA